MNQETKETLQAVYATLMWESKKESQQAAELSKSSQRKARQAYIIQQLYNTKTKEVR